jgi:hypothetical protein
VVGAALLNWAAENFGAGQQHLAQCMKQLVSNTQGPIVELLDYSDDTAFLEPSLFAYFAHKHAGITLEQILLGYLADVSLLPEFTAYADHRGLVYLPRLGHLETAASNSVVTVQSKTLATQLSRLRCLHGTQIELCLTRDPLLEPFFRDADGCDVRFDLDIAGCHAGTLDEAFGVFHRVAPELLRCLVAVSRRVVVFRAEELESFATVSAHGLAFLKVTPPDNATEVFFVEDLAHQCGHILFSALTVHREAYLRVDPHTPLQQLTGTEGEKRDLYTAFHGVFTEALMCIALHSCLAGAVFSGARLHELLGRLSYVMKRFHLDLLSLQDDALFTELGQFVVSQCGAVFDEVFRCTRDDITGFDLRNQSYAFSYERFAALNPEE